MNSTRAITASFLAVIFIMIVGFVSFGINLYQSEQEVETLKTELNNSQSILASTSGELDATKEKLNNEVENSIKLNELLSSTSSALESANTTIEDLKSNEYKLVYIGIFKLTHYCCEEYKHICGTGNGITATGTKVTAGRTIAVDPSVIPYGSQVYIEGYGWRTAEDCGGAVNNKHIDVAVGTHSDAIAMGTLSGGVWLLVKN